MENTNTPTKVISIKIDIESTKATVNRAKVIVEAIKLLKNAGIIDRDTANEHLAVLRSQVKSSIKVNRGIVASVPCPWDDIEPLRMAMDLYKVGGTIGG